MSLEMATSNTPTHLRQHYPRVSITCSSLKHTGVQVVLPMASKQPFPTDSEREKAIMNGTGVFIAVDMGLYSVVENTKCSGPQR